MLKTMKHNIHLIYAFKHITMSILWLLTAWVRSSNAICFLIYSLFVLFFALFVGFHIAPTLSLSDFPAFTGRGRRPVSFHVLFQTRTCTLV
jgi:hypothetical protein